MNIMGKLALKQLSKNRKRTLITLLGIVLSVSMIVAVSGFVVSIKDVFRQSVLENTGDWHVQYTPITQEQVQNVIKDPLVGSHFTLTSEEGELILRFRLHKADSMYMSVSKELAVRNGLSKEGIEYNRELLASEGVIPESNMTMVLSFSGVLIVIIMAGSVLVIANAFYISASERVRQFGLLKSMGATRGQIIRCVMTEGLALCAIGIPIGIGIGFFVEFIALYIANNLLTELVMQNNTWLTFRVVFSPVALGISVAISFVIVMLSAYFPARSSAKASPMDAIRLTREIKVRPRSVKTSKLTQVIFGFEATLAAKAGKRNKGKYRATVVALVVSMVLFIGASSFGQYLNGSVDVMYKDYGITNIVGFDCEDIETAEAIVQEITALPSTTSWVSRSLYAETKSISHLLTQQGQELLTDSDRVALHSISDEAFATLCKEIGKQPGDFATEERLKGIVINTTTIQSNGKIVQFAPFEFEQGTTLTFGMEDKKQQEIALMGAVAQVPHELWASKTTYNIDIVIPEAAMLALQEQGYIFSTMIESYAQDDVAFRQASMDILHAHEISGMTIMNLAQSARMNNNIALLMMVFVYGFVAMLSLIAVTSVVGTISTSMMLRRQEFAMLASVGMTSEGLNRMLRFESLFYGIKALIIGLPLGVGVSFLLYRSLAGDLDFGFIWPLQSMAISVVAVLLLTFLTMRYATKRQRKQSIVEALRGETT